jgi:signal transduction histidine kinase/DNA-binding response OmpR family regulator
MKQRVRPAVSSGWRAYGSTWTLRTVLMISLLLFSLLPAATVGWFFYKSNLQSVRTLSETIIENVAQRVKTDTENHLMQVHEVLNGLIQEHPTEVAVARARLLIQKPELFEQSAFVMTSMMPDVPKMYLGTYEGEFLAVEALAQQGSSFLWVSERKPGLQEGRLFSASYPGDRRVPLPLEPGDYEPRSEVWYYTAMMNKGRAFTPVQVLGNQLQLTLAQPVYAADGAALGVFAVNLPLEHLGQMLQGMRISPHGAVFLLDEKGLLLASSTGDALFSEAGHRQQRHTPEKSRSAMIRSAYADVAPSLGKTSESSVQRESFLHRVPTSQGTLMVALKPFGETWGVHWSLVVVAPESDFTQELQAALQKTLLVTGLTLALGALLAIGVAYQLSRRFLLLSAAAGQLARGKVPPVQHNARITEVHQLSLALHDSAAELRRNQAAIKAHALALRQTNESLEIRVAQRTAELNASREEALSSVRAKAAFLAAMSHEIRTPLNGVVGMATLLADTCLDREQRDYVSTMRISSDQLLGVINDILDFSKIESGRLELEHETLNLHAAIQEACDMNAPRAREKGLELLVDMSEELPGWVCGDVTRLRQVLLNLVNNAVKFTEQGQVMVSAHVREGFTPQQGALVEFQVRDSGIGIPLDQQATLFESFVQVDAGTTRKYGGSGLGLAICKRLAGLMGGSVGLESMPGQGSTFWFTARLGYADPPEALVCPWPYLASPAGTLGAAKEPEPSAPRNQLVLVVDDNAINLKVALAMLARLGYETATAVNGREAVERVAVSLRIGAGQTPRPYAAVLMDLDMPVMDGCTASSEILASHGAAAPPVIALTASVLEDDRRRCLAVGMVDFLSKPLQMAALSGVLARHARHPEPPRAVALTDSEFAGLPLPSGPASRQRIQVLVDWSRLEQFREFDDDELSMTREVIGLFTSESPLRINDIHTSLSACDSAALSRAAHALKGAASNVGAQALSESCGLLEQSCLDGQWPVDAAAQVDRIVGFSDKTCQALSDWGKPSPVLGVPAATV